MVNRLTTVGNKFKTRIQIIDGQEFYGQLLSLPLTSGNMGTERYLKTEIDPPVHTGDVILIGDSSTFIVAEHGLEAYNQPICHHFKLYSVDISVIWMGASSAIDEVTGLSIKTRDQNNGTAYLSFLTQTAQSGSVVVGQKIKTAICNKPVNVGDKLGDMMVVRADYTLGVTLVELKGL